MDGYLDELSVELLCLYRKGQNFHRYDLSQLEAMTDYGKHALCSAIALLRKRNYLEIDPNYSLLHPEEVELLGDTIAADTPLRITKDGLVALEEHELSEKRYEISQIKDRITLVATLAALLISVATLIVSIVAMSKQ